MLRILLIEDDATFTMFLRTVLMTEGHTVLVAKNGRDGQRMCGDEKVDLVITDLVMPQQDGLKTIRRLRREKPGLPIIGISGGMTAGLNTIDYLPAAKEFGADVTLKKPFRPADLLDAVDAAVEAHRRPAAHIA